MKRSALCWLTVCISGLVLHAQDTTPSQNGSMATAPAKIGVSMVWQAPTDFVTNAHAACDKSAGAESFPECFINQMSVAGAPSAAVAFTRMFYQQNDGQVAIMTAFKSFSTVDAAQVFYPLRANDNYGLLLVNGTPKIIDVDDLKKLDQAAMQQNPMFQAVKQKYAKTDLFRNDHSGSNPWPRVEPLPAGGTQFVVTYQLLDGCHACQRVGLARFGWDFDASGKFLRTTFIPTPPPPKILPRPRTPAPPAPPSSE